jgi:hypothetical protein
LWHHQQKIYQGRPIPEIAGFTTEDMLDLATPFSLAIAEIFRP